MNQYITVTSGSSDPCDFISNFSNSININDGYEVAITRIFHGPVFNFDSNTKFTIIRGNAVVNFKIPAGFYETTSHVLLAIYNTLVKSINDPSRHGIIKTKPEFKNKQYGDSSYLKLLDVGVNFIIDNDLRDTSEMVLQTFGYCVNSRFNRIDINHSVLQTATEAGFLYSNIISSSVIDNQRSRLLCCAPLTSSIGYNCYEFTNPAYLPLRVDSFTDISFQLRNVKGEKIKIAHLKEDHSTGDDIVEYPTIIILHIRKSL